MFCFFVVGNALLSCCCCWWWCWCFCLFAVVSGFCFVGAVLLVGFILLLLLL